MKRYDTTTMKIGLHHLSGIDRLNPVPPDSIEDWQLVAVNITCDNVFWTWSHEQECYDCPASKDIEHAIEQVRRNVAKNQYVNALYWATEIDMHLHRLLSDVLKGRE